MSAQHLAMNDDPAPRRHQAVSLSEAARRFQALGRGPSRATLSRASAEGNLAACQAAPLKKRQGQRPLYRFEALCAYYSVNPDLPAHKRERRSAANDAGGGGGLGAPAPGRAALVDTDLQAIMTRFDQAEQQLNAMRETVLAATRDGRDLGEVRRTLMLKYDAENGHLRQRLDAAEDRARQNNAIDTLSREVGSLRQSLARLVELVQERLPEPSTR